MLPIQHFQNKPYQIKHYNTRNRPYHRPLYIHRRIMCTAMRTSFNTHFHFQIAVAAGNFLYFFFHFIFFRRVGARRKCPWGTIAHLYLLNFKLSYILNSVICCFGVMHHQCCCTLLRVYLKGLAQFNTELFGFKQIKDDTALFQIGTGGVPE